MVVSCSIFVYVLHERMGESHLFEFSLDLGISTLEVSLFDFTTPGTRLFFFLFFSFYLPQRSFSFPRFLTTKNFIMMWISSTLPSPPLPFLIFPLFYLIPTEIWDSPFSKPLFWHELINLDMMPKRLRKTARLFDPRVSRRPQRLVHWVSEGNPGRKWEEEEDGNIRNGGEKEMEEGIYPYMDYVCRPVYVQCMLT